MDSKNSWTSDPHRLLFNLTDKINLRRSDKYVTLSDFIIYMEKYKKSHTKIINLKYQLLHGMKNLNFFTGSYSASNIQEYFEYRLKKQGTKTRKRLEKRLTNLKEWYIHIK